MKYLPGEITGTMSGSIGGKTASHNRSGAYFRTKVTPTNPNSIRQQAVRAAFGTLVQYWMATLSAADRALWEAYAAGVPVTDKLGQTINLTGQNMFIRSNTPRVQAGLAIVDSAPTTLNTGEPATSCEAVSDAEANVLETDNSEIGWNTQINVAGGASDDGDVLLYIGPSISLTRNFYAGPYQLCNVTEISATDTDVTLANAFALDQNANGAPIPEQHRGVKILVAYDDGRLSQAYTAILPVVAAPV